MRANVQPFAASVLICMVLAGCMNASELPGSVDKVVTHKVEKDVYIPIVNGLQITEVILKSPNEEKPEQNTHQVVVKYARKRGKFVPIDSKKREELEKKDRGRYVFGVYSGKPVVTLTYHAARRGSKPTSLFGRTPSSIKTEEKKDGKTISVTVPFQNGTYTYDCRISRQFTKKQCMEVAKAIQREYQRRLLR